MLLRVRWIDSLLQLHEALVDVVGDSFVGASILTWRLLCRLLMLLNLRVLSAGGEVLIKHAEYLILDHGVLVCSRALIQWQERVAESVRAAGGRRVLITIRSGVC